MNNGKILIIDDEAGIRSSLQGILEDEGYTVKTTDSGEKGIDLIQKENFDLVLLDIWLPEIGGLEVLEKIKKSEDNIQVVMITGHGSIETAVKATKLGAYDFLEKPLSLEKVVLTANNALKQKNLEEENIQLRERIKLKYQLIGESPAIQKLRIEIDKIATTDGRVLIFGENGTGKELVARLIHQNSPRRNKRFIQINTGAIPEEIIERELFGYVRGTYPYSEKDKKGKLLLADGGTLFLDDIGKMGMKTQSRLVSVIEEQNFEPLGSSSPIPLNTRFITATNENLRDLIAKGNFREDLFFKLNVIPLTIPPLRERKEDIPFLIDYFLKYFAEEFGKKKKTMNKEALAAFISYSWPGNVSELINVIERFVIMVQEDIIDSSHLYLLVEPRESQVSTKIRDVRSFEEARNQFDREYIHSVLIRNNWNIEKAASDLKLSQAQLNLKIKNLHIHFLG